MRTLIASLGCLGVLVAAAAIVGAFATRGQWGFVVLEAVGVALIIARMAAGGDRG